MKQSLSLSPPPTATWLAGWSKGRIIRLIIFIAIASALLPLFISDRLRGSRQQLIYYPTQTYQNSPINQATTSAQLASLGKTAELIEPSLTPTRQVTPKLTTPAKPKVVTPTKVAEFSDTSMLIALNSYRAAHQIHPLVEEAHLCQYAESRVKDLLELGTLDGHAGFNADFADPLRIPQAIKDYPGGAIGEDLASQYCINMTTGQSLVATTPTALIEWCFDSSTKGHRESLLNDKFNNACIRHGSNMYVVLLGE